MLGLLAHIIIESKDSQIQYSNNAILQISIEPNTLDISITAFSSKIKNMIINYILKIVSETGNPSSFIKVTVTHQEPNKDSLGYIINIDEAPSKDAQKNIEAKLDEFVLRIEKDIIWEIIRKPDFKAQRIRYDIGRAGKRV